MFRRLTAENLTQDHEFSAVKTAGGLEDLLMRSLQRIVSAICVTVCLVAGALVVAQVVVQAQAPRKRLLVRRRNGIDTKPLRTRWSRSSASAKKPACGTR